MIAKDESVLMQFSAEAWNGLYIADMLHREYLASRRELVVTSGSEPIQHTVARSAHHRGDAFDMRRWYLDDVNKFEEYVAELREKLTADWVVFVEDDHIHCHWSPVAF